MQQSSSDDFEITRTGRYHQMREQYRTLFDEQLICGLQIHVGVSDRDTAVELAQRVSWKATGRMHPVSTYTA